MEGTGCAHRRRLAGGILLLGLLASCGSERQDTERFSDTGEEILGDPRAVVMTIGDEPIRLAEVDLVVQFWRESGAREGRGARTRRDLQIKALEQTVDQIVLSQAARRQGIAVPDSIIDQIVVNWESRFASPEEAQRKIAASGVDLEMLRTSFRRDELVRRLVEQTIRDTLHIPDEEIRRYYEANLATFDTTQIHAAHLLFYAPQGSPPESLLAARERARDALAQLEAGADFAALAVVLSDCPSATRGGDLGFLRLGAVERTWGAAAAALTPGEISDVVRTNTGFHIIKLIERGEGEVVTLEDAAAWIKAQLTQMRIESTLAALAARLRREQSIVVPFE